MTILRKLSQNFFYHSFWISQQNRQQNVVLICFIHECINICSLEKFITNKQKVLRFISYKIFVKKPHQGLEKWDEVL